MVKRKSKKKKLSKSSKKNQIIGIVLIAVLIITGLVIAGIGFGRTTGYWSWGFWGGTLGPLKLLGGDECSIGEKKCEWQGNTPCIVTCAKDSNGNWKWGMGYCCPEGKTCTNGEKGQNVECSSGGGNGNGEGGMTCECLSFYAHPDDGEKLCPLQYGACEISDGTVDACQGSCFYKCLGEDIYEIEGDACFQIGTPSEPYCGDGIINGDEECEEDIDCQEEGQVCNNCKCLQSDEPEEKECCCTELPQDYLEENKPTCKLSKDESNCEECKEGEECSPGTCSYYCGIEVNQYLPTHVEENKCVEKNSEEINKCGCAQIPRGKHIENGHEIKNHLCELIFVGCDPEDPEKCGETKDGCRYECLTNYGDKIITEDCYTGCFLKENQKGKSLLRRLFGF